MLKTCPRNCGVVKDGKIIIGAGLTLLQVERHPGQLDDVARGPHYHPPTIHPVGVLLRLRENKFCSKYEFQHQNGNNKDILKPPGRAK